MGWANCGTDSRDRPIGYAHAARCDHPGCNAKIDRGLAYACGGMHGDGAMTDDDMLNDVSCERYFCGDHLRSVNLEHEDGADWCAEHSVPFLCFACASQLERDYRQSDDWREAWPTSSPPLPCDSGSHPEGENGEAG